MNKLLKVLIGIALVSMFGMGTVHAQDMAGGPHDLIALTGVDLPPGMASQDLCRFCHTPHNSGTVAPLWDRQPAATVSFDLYPGPGGTMAGTPSLSGVSGGCMSCHDGATAFDAIGTYTAGTVTMTTKFGATGLPGAEANLGGDLSNDHPIGVSVTGAGQMALAGPIDDTALTLFGAGTDIVECATCHDAHMPEVAEGGFPYLLRMDPGLGTLCETCHLK